MIDGTDLDIFLCQPLQHLYVRVAGLCRLLTRHCYEGLFFAKADEIGIQRFTYLFEQIIFTAVQQVASNHQCDGINSGQTILEGESALFKDIQHKSAESGSVRDHDFLNLDDGHSFSSGDTCHRILNDARRKMTHNHGAGIIRPVRIANINGNLHFGSRKYGIRVQDGCPHIGKGPEFPVAHMRNRFGMIDYSGICGIKTGYVRPVLIEIRA